MCVQPSCTSVKACSCSSEPHPEHPGLQLICLDLFTTYLILFCTPEWMKPPPTPPNIWHFCLSQTIRFMWLCLTKRHMVPLVWLGAARCRSICIVLMLQDEPSHSNTHTHTPKPSRAACRCVASEPEAATRTAKGNKNEAGPT